MPKYTFKEVEPDFYNNEEWEGIDWIMDCSTPKATDQVINKIMQQLSPSETDAIFRTYFNIKTRTVKKQRKPKTPKQNLKYIYDLLTVADSIHDFGDIGALTQEDKIAQASAIIEEFNVKLPTRLTVNILRDESQFIQFMKNQRTLEFANTAINNPLYGADIMTQFKVPTKDITIDAMFESQTRSVIGKLSNKTPICPLDIYTDYSAAAPGKKSREYMKLHQVSQLCAAIRLFMGDYAVFEVDSIDNQLIQLIIGVSNISEKLYDLYFATSGPDPFITVSNQLKAAIATAPNSTKTEWVALTTDANLFDAAINNTKLQYDNRPTGKIFLFDPPYQIELKGLTTQRRGPGQFVSVTFTDNNNNQPSVDLIMANGETTNFCSTQTMYNYMLSTPPHPPPPPPPPPYKDIRQQFQAFSNPLKYAIKRAGDWGQVENAKRYNKIFVTSDKLAALYAYYRGVKCIYLRRCLDIPNSICRYTFVLFK